MLLTKDNTHTVAIALAHLRHELTKPAGIFDSFAALAALENLVDVSRETGDNNATRFNSIYKQTRPLQNHTQFQALLLKLVGDKNDVEIAKIIEKSLKAPPPPPYAWHAPLVSCTPPRPPNPPNPARLGTFRPQPYNQQPTFHCYNCRGAGHYARNCPLPRRR